MQRDLRRLDDVQLTQTAEKLIRSESRLQTCQIRIFAEMARRRLHLREGYDSLFTYLVKKYGQPKACAYQRSTIALVSERWPELLSMIEDRRLSLAAATVVAKHLNKTDGQTLLQACAGKTKEEVEMIVAGHTKTPVIRDVIRPVGVRPGAGKPLPAKEPQVQGPEDECKTDPCAPNSTFRFPTKKAHTPPIEAKAEDIIVKVSFATNKRVSDKLARAKDLLARKVPQGALSDVLEEVLDDYLKRHDPKIKAKRRVEAAAEKKKEGKQQPSPQSCPKDAAVRINNAQRELPTHSRYIPMAVKHLVMVRDGGRCTYVSPQGVRCGATRNLEWDHVRPFALGGSSTDPANVRVLCASHNRQRARQTFGGIEGETKVRREPVWGHKQAPWDIGEGERPVLKEQGSSFGP